MLELDIPGYGSLALEYLVLDMNGTVTCGGEVIAGVAEGVRALAGTLQSLVVTADSRGTARELAAGLGLDVRIVAGEWEAGEKLEVIQELGPERVVAVGNGANDALVLSSCAVGICVIGPEGAARSALESGDVIVHSVTDALALLADPARLAATLRR